MAPMTMLGRAGLAISRLGIGTRAIGGGDDEFGWGPQDEAAATTPHLSLAGRFNWIGTAPAYGVGGAGVLIGRALEGVATRPLIFTKCSRPWRKLMVDCADLYQIHRPWPEDDLAKRWETQLSRLNAATPDRTDALS